MSINLIILAFTSGIVGCLIGGMQAFIVYGFLGIFTTILATSGYDMTWINQYIMNFYFLPAIMFGSTVPATAYASRKYDIPGYQISRSLAFTRDPIVFLIGGCGSVLGYLLFEFATRMNLPMDTGAFSVLVSAVLFRLIFNKGQKYNEMGIKHIRYMPIKDWIYEIMLALVIAYATGFFVDVTGFVSIGFSISAASLLLQCFDETVPTTHHITMVAGYAMMQTHNMALVLLFSVISHIIFLLFAEVLNSDCGTHIDPPAVGIGLCSLILFTLF